MVFTPKIVTVVLLSLHLGSELAIVALHAVYPELQPICFVGSGFEPVDAGKQLLIVFVGFVRRFLCSGRELVVVGVESWIDVAG